VRTGNASHNRELKLEELKLQELKQMSREAQRHFDVLVIGGGPAGMAAAARAAECGARVGIVDDNFRLGGQIWRGESDAARSDHERSNVSQNTEASRWTDRLRASGATALCGLRVVHQPDPGVLLAENLDGFCELTYDKLVLATGARERFLPFPGWTLPNVMGAGGLQAMVKSGLPIQGKRVVVAGTGPLLLAVASYLRQHGAEIPVICEQASWKSLAKFGLTLFSWPQKIIQGFQLKRDLAGVSFAANSWPLAAHGQKTLESVTISRAGKNQNIPCDYLACGFHLVPNIELPLLLGCAVDNGCVQVDDLQTTTVPSVFCAGEPTSVGGVELALIEGQVAGLAAAGHASGARKLFGKRQKARRFARLLDRTFRLRSELRSLSLPDTIVCRCEDVSYSRLRQHRSWRAAKLHTRCGMGPCQGRVCGPATQFLFNWNPDSVRPPVFPARVETLAAVTAQSQLQHSEVTGGRS
jgi:NADPH-dependent 2,4-dienoyl-CoA reductase/sulfur reductase-like enzyme